MNENKEMQNNPVEIIDEQDTEMSQILEGFETPKQDSNAKKKNSELLKLIIAIVVLGAIIGAIFAITTCAGNNDDEIATTEAEIITSVDGDNMWQAEVTLDNNGKIKQNGTGDLTEYVPAQISLMEISNEAGNFAVESYTPINEDGESDTTEYTLVGFEDFPLQSGVPDEIATDCSSVSFLKVIEVNATENLADYGLDNPVATATVTYTDGTKATITVGGTAPQSEYRYITFGASNTVYVVSGDEVDALLYDVRKLISLTVNDSVTDSSDAEFSYIKLSGKAYGDTITLKYNDDTTNMTASYMLTTPKEVFADSENASLVTGGIRGVYASEVICLNPTAKQLEKYGIAEKYACITAKYPDTTVKLIASEPDDSGMCYLMVDGGNIIYQIASSSIYWVEVNFDSLVSTYVLSPNMQGLTTMTVDTGADAYTFNLNTVTEETTDDDGTTSSTTTTTVKYKGEELSLGYFQTFFENITYLEKCDLNDDSISGEPALAITYTYKSGRSKDVIKFYKAENTKYAVTINGEVVGHVYSSYVSKIIEQTPKIAKDISVTSFW